MSKRTSLSLLSLVLSVVALIALFAATPKPTQALPADFEDELLTTLGLNTAPTDLVFTPDGRLLITEQLSGRIRVYFPVSNTLTTAYTFPSTAFCSYIEQGILGITVDPTFSSNNYVYVFYTFNKLGTPDQSTCVIPVDGTGRNRGNAVNRVSRFTLTPANTLINELVILDNIPIVGSIHQSGDVAFGADGLLYITTGDSECDFDTNICDDVTKNNNSPRKDLPLGKILRITREGTIPDDNPFVNEPGARRCTTLLEGGFQAGNGPCKEIFAYGLRNPFRIAFKPGTNTFYINDVGQSKWEEINLGIKGANYGWPTREGFCPLNVNNPTTCNNNPAPATMTNPIAAYPHVGGQGSVVGGGFVPESIWPQAYEGTFMFFDYGVSKLYRLNVNNTITELDDTVDTPINLVFGPYNSPTQGATQAIYYINHKGLDPGGVVGPQELHRIKYVGNANRAPVARFTADPVYSSTVPLNINFNASASSDPDAGNTITKYIWNFGDNSPVVTTTVPTTNHSYSAGVYTVTLKVQDNLGLNSLPVTTQVYPGNLPPTINSLTPSEGFLFTVGEAITLTASVSDPDAGDTVSVYWRYVRRHIDHIHSLDFSPVMTGGGPYSFTIEPLPAEDLGSVANSRLEVQLVATDSKGLSTVVTRILNPKIGTVNLRTNPVGASIRVQLDSMTGPATIQAWEGKLPIEATSPQDTSLGTLTFGAWADNAALPKSRSITVTSTPTTYTANFLVGGCDLLKVTKTNDGDGAGDCGTLRYGLKNAADSETLTLQPPGNVITLTSSLAITRPVTIKSQGACNITPEQTTVTINGNLVLGPVVGTGNILLSKLQLVGTAASTTLQANKGAARFNCVKVTS